MKRKVDIAVISDIHLGTYGCHAKELNHYLKSIQPSTLILNGDIIDMWYFKKKYFPKEHLEVVRRILKMASNGTKVYYLTGNHDDMLRKFGEMTLGLIHLRNKLVFQVDGKKHWVFHGDVFDVSIQKSALAGKLGSEGYDMLIRINRLVNKTRALFGLKPASFSAKVKKSVKGAVRFISDFENTAIQIAADNGYDYVICGHIHQPQMRQVETPNGHVVNYLNSGDWIEHLTALEYSQGEWNIFQYDSLDFEVVSPRLQVREGKQKEHVLQRAAVMPSLNGMAAFEAV